MANPYKGEVEIKLNHSIAKKLIAPHGKVHLKYNMESIGMMERVFKKEFGSDTSIFEILRRNQENPYKVSVYETTVMLEYGLMPTFPTMNYTLASRILDQEDMVYVVSQVMKALNLAFEGVIPMENFTGAAQEVGDQDAPAEAVDDNEPEMAVEGVAGKKS
jgi:hypothetical protein